MEGKNTCEMICDNLKDEHEAQPTYKKLANQLEKEGHHNEAEAIKKLIVKDEASHEGYMEVLDKSHMCGCK